MGMAGWLDGGMIVASDGTGATEEALEPNGNGSNIRKALRQIRPVRSSRWWQLACAARLTIAQAIDCAGVSRKPYLPTARVQDP